MILLLDSEQRDDEEKGKGEGSTNKYVLYLDADVPSRICIDALPTWGYGAMVFSILCFSLFLSFFMCVCDMHMSAWSCVCWYPCSCGHMHVEVKVRQLPLFFSTLGSDMESLTEYGKP